MRVTQLDGCGKPVYGDSSVGVSDGFVSVAFTANTDEGDAIDVTNAAGKSCVHEVPCPTFQGYGVEITFCNVDPALFAILTGQEAVEDYAGLETGFRINSDISGCDSGFALEVWTGVPGVQCADDAAAGGTPSGYMLLPFVQGGIFGDFTVENDAISFSVTGAQTKTGSGWGVGPYDVVPGSGGVASKLANPIKTGDHLHIQYTDVNPPSSSCGTKPLLDPTGAELTGVTATPGAGHSAQFSPTPTSSDPWWIDFGDGTWDYAADGGSITHAYATAGSYTYVAYRGSSMFTGTTAVTATKDEAKAGAK